MTRLQQDELLLPARALVPLLRAGSSRRAKPARQARDRSWLAWGFVMGRDSVPAAIYATWEKAVKLAVWERSGPTRGPRDLARAGRLPLGPMLRRLAEPDAVFGADPVAGRDALAARCARPGRR